MQQQMINIYVCIFQFLKFILNMWYNMVYTIFYFFIDLYNRNIFINIKILKKHL